jgi:ADP-heptose:LPS heptosyltransferase
MLVVLTGAPRSFHTVFDDIDEIGLANDIATVHPGILNLAGQLTVRELGALLSECNAFLTCDTGPMHVGSAVRAPMVVLSGAADPDRTGPINEQATVLIDRSFACVPCRQRTCMFGDVRCMSGLSTNRVIEALSQKLDNELGSTTVGRNIEPQISLIEPGS